MSTQLFEEGFDRRRTKPRDTYLSYSLYRVCMAVRLTYEQIISRRANGKFKCRDMLSLAKFIVEENEQYPHRQFTKEEELINAKKCLRINRRRNFKVSMKKLAADLQMDIQTLRYFLKKYKIDTSDLLKFSYFIVNIYKNNNNEDEYCPTCGQKITRSLV